MLGRAGKSIATFALIALTLGWTAPSDAADGGIWHVAKQSGRVWVARGVQLVALGDDTALADGDEIRTGNNGRVLLTRGQERILISPNSSIGLPKASADGYPTTIAQRAGSILLEVEKKNVRHFEVETPYLAAVVKGTHFRVSVNKRGGRVDVLRGQVLVTDFKSGQNVLVLPGQSARDSAQGAAGLRVSGTGKLNPVLPGKPRASTLRVLSIPKGGLGRPRLALNNPGKGKGANALARADRGGLHLQQRSAGRTIRIRAAVGELKVNFGKVTHGLAHGVVPAPGLARGESEHAANETGGGMNASADASAGNGDSLGNGGNGIGNGGGNGLGNGSGAGLGNVGGNGGGNGVGLANGVGGGPGNGLANGLINGVGNASGKGKGHGKGG